MCFNMIKKILAVLIAVCGIGMAVSVSSPVLALTCPDGTYKAGKKDATSLAECDITVDDKTAKQVTNRVEKAINVVLGFVGVAAVAVIILGGIQYITSQGDAGKAIKARTTIIYGIVGLAICLLAYAIVNLVLTGVFSD